MIERLFSNNLQVSLNGNAAQSSALIKCLSCDLCHIFRDRNGLQLRPFKRKDADRRHAFRNYKRFHTGILQKLLRNFPGVVFVQIHFFQLVASHKVAEFFKLRAIAQIGFLQSRFIECPSGK